MVIKVVKWSNVVLWGGLLYFFTQSKSTLFASIPSNTPSLTNPLVTERFAAKLQSLGMDVASFGSTDQSDIWKAAPPDTTNATPVIKNYIQGLLQPSSIISQEKANLIANRVVARRVFGGVLYSTVGAAERASRKWFTQNLYGGNYDAFRKADYVGLREQYRWAL